MRALKPILAILVLASSCGPDNQEVTDEQVETGNRVEVLDSIANTRKDALRTDENELTESLPLPAGALTLLDKQYPGWQPPVLPQDKDSDSKNSLPGSTFVQGNFNNDTLTDYALQLQQGEDVVIVALLQDSATWEAHELKRDILFNERGKLISLYNVELVEKGTLLQDKAAQQSIKAPTDGIALRIANSPTAYIYNNKNFRAYTANGL